MPFTFIYFFISMLSSVTFEAFPNGDIRVVLLIEAIISVLYIFFAFKRPYKKLLFSSLVLQVMGSLSLVIVGTIRTLLPNTGVAVLAFDMLFIAIYLYILKVVFALCARWLRKSEICNKIPFAIIMGLYVCYNVLYILSCLQYEDTVKALNIIQVLPIFVTVVSITVITAMLIFFYKYRFTKREFAFHRMQYEQMNIYFNDIISSRGEFRALRHDMRGHFIVLSHLLSEGTTEQAQKYLSEITQQTKVMDNIDRYDNLYVDAVVHYAILEAKSKEIELEVSVSLPEYLPCQSADLVCIFYNLLNNALQGSRAGDTIAVRAAYEAGALAIRVENSLHDNGAIPLNIVRPTWPVQKNGYGLSNVRDAARRNAGEFNLYKRESKIVAEVTMLLSELEESLQRV